MLLVLERLHEFLAKFLRTSLSVTWARTARNRDLVLLEGEVQVQQNRALHDA
jgi:hypothetical protein